MALNLVPGTDEESVEWDELTLGTTYTVACKVKVDSGSAVGLQQAANSGHVHFQLGTGSGNNASLRVSDGTNAAEPAAIFSFTSSDWVTILGTREGDDVSSYAEVAGNSLASASASSSPGSIASLTSTRFAAGCLVGDSDTKGGATSAEMDGKVAEVAVWDGIALTAGEREAYHAGVSPLMIRPGALIFYAPLWGNTNASAHENIATATNYNPIFNGTPDAADHPPVGRLVQMPSPPQRNVEGTISGNIIGQGNLLRRLLRVYDRDTGVLVESVYSDPVTGYYETISNLDRTKEYFVVEIDE